MSRITVLGTVLALGLSASTFAAPAKNTSTHATPSTSGTKSSGAWATGHVERFDTLSNTLVMKQGTYEMTFGLAPNAKVTQGSKVIPAADLTRDAGRYVKVRYTTESGKRIANRVELSETAASHATSKSHSPS